MSLIVFINYINFFFVQCLYYIGFGEYNSKKECKDEENLIKIKKTESVIFDKNDIKSDYIHHGIDFEDTEKNLLEKSDNECRNCSKQFGAGSLEHMFMGKKYCNTCWEWRGLKNKFKRNINLYS